MSAPGPRLTRTQRETLVLVANGNTNAQIAAWRGVAAHSVAEVLTAAYRRLGATDRAQAVALALRYGLLHLSEIRLPTDSKERP
ncbi:response regulator transcription factor [Streptomyces sp. DH8]|uniref:response regulator transcription factor n=1 Tax=Streptomyces sp. DH8 TaxID=2857008 RepID=UPI001E5E53BC|nr:helix-turn-helix transcriptional regulator [Streptomyces sp. DH8]